MSAFSSYFFFSLSFSRNYPLVLFITWIYHITLQIYLKKKVSKVGNRSREWPEGLFFIKYYTGVGEGATPFLVLHHFTLNFYLIMLRVKQGGIKYYFLVFGVTQPGIEPRSPRPLANTLLTSPIFVYYLTRAHPFSLPLAPSFSLSLSLSLSLWVVQKIQNK